MSGTKAVEDRCVFDAKQTDGRRSVRRRSVEVGPERVNMAIPGDRAEHARRRKSVRGDNVPATAASW